MARRVGLPAPTLSPFGESARSFGQYDVLDTSRDDGREFQRAQAQWAAGRISDDAYLAAYEKYVRGLPAGSSQRINAQQSLDRERYTFARNDIVARIDAGDESAWDDLLAFDRRSLAGMQGNNEEYQRRLSYLRSTQNAIFASRWNEVVQRVQQGRMTTTQLHDWLRSQRGSALTAGNAQLARDIADRIEQAKIDMAKEQQELTYERWQEGRMGTEDFLIYAKAQQRLYQKGTPEYRMWNSRASAARLAVQDARIDYRWKLSQQYHENQLKLGSPPPGVSGKAGKTRTVYKTGKGWVEAPVEEAPSAADTDGFHQWQAEQEGIKAEQKRIEQRLARAGLDFMDPRDVIRFLRARQQGVVKGTPEWLSLQDQIGQFVDTAAQWDMVNAESGMFPTRVGDAFTTKTKGRRIPGEQQITVSSFMRALGQAYGGPRQQAQAGLKNRFGISSEEWKVWAGQYLGDASARMTPDNMNQVVRQRLQDMHSRYGSWAVVGYAWLNGGAELDRIGDWSPESRKFVNRLWMGMGLGQLPGDWTFDASKYRIPAAQPETDPRRMVPGATASLNGWGYRSDRGGGANLTDVSAGAAAYGVKLTDQDVSWNELVRRLKRGESAVANGLMSEVQGTGLERWDRNFAAKGSESRHSVHIIRYQDGKIFWQDPLATNGYKGEWVDEEVVKRFMLGYSGNANDLGVAMSNQRVDQIPALVSEREPGAWTGCAWASGAMLVNGIKGRRVATMQEIRRFGESGKYAPSGGFATSLAAGAKAEPKQGQKANKKADRFPNTDRKGRITPGPQPGPTTFQWADERGAGADTDTANKALNPNVAGPPAAGQEPFGRDRPSGPQLYAITGPPRVPGQIPELTKTKGIRGMGPGEFDNLYAAARGAVLSGEQSFVFRNSNGELVNYYVPGDPAYRAELMNRLDFARVELKEHEWQMAEAVLVAVGDAATEEQINQAAERRESHTLAVETMGQNALDMLFMQQQTQQEGSLNINPGADMERIAQVAQKAAQAKIDAGQARWDAGHTTQAIALWQEAEDILTVTGGVMDQLAAQVQVGVQQQQAMGVAPTEEQRAQIEGTVEWGKTFGFDKQVQAIQESRDEAFKWLQLDEAGNPIIGPDNEIVMRAGTVNVLKHSTDGSPDTIDRQIIDIPGVQPSTQLGQLEPMNGLPDHVVGAVTIMGKAVVAQIPYTVGPVGMVVTDDGQQVKVWGKIINVNVDGRRQVSFEDPFQPGRWSTVDVDGVEAPVGMIFKAPPGVTAQPGDQPGDAPILTWEGEAKGLLGDGGSTLSLHFNRAINSYEIVEQRGRGLMDSKDPEPVVLGTLADNLDLQDQLSQKFARDFSGVPKSVMAAQNQMGVWVGRSAAEAAQQAKIEAWQQARAQNTARLLQGEKQTALLFAQEERAKRAETLEVPRPVARVSPPRTPAPVSPSPSPRTPAPPASSPKPKLDITKPISNKPISIETAPITSPVPQSRVVTGGRVML